MARARHTCSRCTTATVSPVSSQAGDVSQESGKARTACGCSKGREALLCWGAFSALVPTGPVTVPLFTWCKDSVRYVVGRKSEDAG
ncbi:hypothetical protein BaRGS_00002285 [Batillaria attramentaria]|uniref:Uncharacterized protein n=1 Tax=Batillaria attramentaria TaxID=370345 RepID=A0ABD0M463_9CAEN